jgi:hypothetical protein
VASTHDLGNHLIRQFSAQPPRFNQHALHSVFCSSWGDPINAGSSRQDPGNDLKHFSNLFSSPINLASSPMGMLDAMSWSNWPDTTSHPEPISLWDKHQSILTQTIL